MSRHTEREKKGTKTKEKKSELTTYICRNDRGVCYNAILYAVIQGRRTWFSKTESSVATWNPSPSRPGGDGLLGPFCCISRHLALSVSLPHESISRRTERTSCSRRDFSSSVARSVGIVPGNTRASIRSVVVTVQTTSIIILLQQRPRFSRPLCAVTIIIIICKPRASYGRRSRRYGSRSVSNTT